VMLAQMNALCAALFSIDSSVVIGHEYPRRIGRAPRFSAKRQPGEAESAGNSAV
jgi:hypothetical protein